MSYKIKLILKVMTAIVMLSTCGTVFAEQMNAFVEENVFMHENGITRYEIAYSVPFDQMMFIKETPDGEKERFTATLEVSLILSYQGQERVIESSSKKAQTYVESNTKKKDLYLTDKVILDSKREGLNIKLKIEDFVSGKVHVWDGKTKVFNYSETDFVSDLEFSNSVMQYKQGYSEKLVRRDSVYLVNPSHMFSEANKVHLYYEYYGNENTETEYEESISMVVNGVGKLIRKFETKSTQKVNYRHLPLILNPDEFNNGVAKFDIRVSVTNKTTGKTCIKSEKVAVAEIVTHYSRFFEDIEDEVTLVNYFAKSKDKKNWDNLSDEGKLKRVAVFWSTLDKESINAIRERINTANTRFGGVIKGWKTDMGRIYIKFGEPDEFERDDTNKFINSGGNEEDDIDAYSDILLTSRRYEIWRYMQGGTNAVYLFIETNSNGIFKLMYGKNDKFPTENIERNWRKYLGNNFDEAELSY